MLAGASFVGRGGVAHAQTADELKAARELFQEAYKDEQEKRYEQALDKFQRVARVRESASVRYRIASVLESLGRLREARDAFRALAAKKPDLEKKEHEIADSSAERAAALDKKIPKLVVRTDKAPPQDMRVTVDGASVPASQQPRSIELDPGEHVVQASAPNTREFETHVKLAEGSEVALVVPVDPPAPPPPPPPPGGETPPPEKNNTLAYVALGAGGVLLATGIVLLVIRENDIAAIHSKCPRDVCPTSAKDEIESDRDQAKLFGPLGFGLAAVGVAAGAAGVYLLVKPSSASSAPPSNGAPTSPQAGAFRIGPRPVRGGAILGVGASF